MCPTARGSNFCSTPDLPGSLWEGLETFSAHSPLPSFLNVFGSFLLIRRKNIYILGLQCCHQEQRIQCAPPPLESGTRGLSAEEGACEARCPLEGKRSPEFFWSWHEEELVYCLPPMQGELAPSSCRGGSLGKERRWWLASSKNISLTSLQ